MRLRTTLLGLLTVFPFAQTIVIFYFISSVWPEAVSGTSLRSIMVLCLTLMIIILLLSIVASIVACKLIISPVSKMMDAIKQVKSGDYKARLYYSKENEIGELASAFNGLMETIEHGKEHLTKTIDEFTEREAHYQFSLSVSQELIFKVDIATDEFTTSSERWKEFFGKSAPKKYTEAFMMVSEMVHPEELVEFNLAFAPERLRSASAGDQFKVTCEARVLNKEGKYIWTQNTIQTAGGDHNRSIIGKIADIDGIKKKEFDIISESQKDGLTGLLRKNVTEKLIVDYLEGDGKDSEHGMLIIDIDDFKLINDKAGHLYGDAVLTELSKRIQNLFRNTDIVGRIGGDEFLILLKNIKYNNLIIEKADAVIDIFDAISSTMQSVNRISGSMGIVRYPADGTTYRELFQKADKALYGVKDKGKNAYSFYDDNFERKRFLTNVKKEDYFQPRKQDDPLLIKTAKHSKETITRDIFQILYESRDIKKSINLIMEIIGRFYDVSRVYIFELFGEQLHYTYEWCNEGITPDIDSFTVTNMEDLLNYKHNFNEEGIFYCEDTTKLPDTVYKGEETNRVHSLLECAILNKGEFAGFIGFEECNNKRFWVKDEIEMLVIVARILAIVLVQDRK